MVMVVWTVEADGSVEARSDMNMDTARFQQSMMCVCMCVCVDMIMQPWKLLNCTVGPDSSTLQ